MRKNRIINFIIIIIILVIMIWLIIDEYKNNQIQKNTSKYNTNSLSNINTTNEQKNSKQDQNIKKTQNKTESAKKYPKEKIISEYKGYDVTAKLEIPKIKLKTYVLKNFTEQAMKICITKLEGPNPNTNGNFCIVGHNFKNMFKDLKKMKIGDTFTISDNKVGKVTYEIYDIYTVVPQDTSCLSQKTNNLKEVTLITCTTDSKRRIIVKAQEMEKK